MKFRHCHYRHGTTQIHPSAVHCKNVIKTAWKRSLTMSLIYIMLNAIWVAVGSFRLSLSLHLVSYLICIHNCYWSRLTSVRPLCFTGFSPPFCHWKATRTHIFSTYAALSYMLCNTTRGDSATVWFSFYVILFLVFRNIYIYNCSFILVVPLLFLFQ